MPPVTQKPPISAEGIKAKNSIAEVRQQVNLGATPQEARATLGDIKKGYIPSQLPTQPLVATRLNPTIPNVIPSTALAGNKTFEDVMDTRANLETQATAKQQLTDRIKGTTDRIGATTSSTFENPDAIINRLALNRVPTETEAQRAAKQAGAVQNRRDYAGDIATARQDLGTQYGLPDLTARKAEVTTQYTEREQKMNDDIKRLEENASKRGVARQYVEAEKQKIKSDALEDLSNYAAIEAALSGSITEARSIINDSINDKKSAFELENQSIQQEINYLSTLVGEDNQREATQLQIALDERKRLQDAQLAKETAIRNYAADVAAEGADDGTINAILKSGTEEEALRYAAPYLGKTQRAQAYASIRSSNASAALNEAELLAFNKVQEDAANGILTADQMGTANDLNKDFESQPIVKAYNEGLQKYIVLEDTLANGIDGVQDLQLVYDFMKSVDPTSVVRETEFANAAKTGNIFQGAYAGFNKAFGSGGFLPEEVKADFTRAARASFEAKNNQYFNVKSEYANRINNTLGTNNGADYLTAYENAAPLTEIDFGLADSLSGATPDELLDIMKRTEGLVGVNLYK